MDRGETQLTCTRIGKAVSRVGRRDDNLASFTDELNIIVTKRRLSRFDDKYFWIGMPMQGRPLTGAGMHQNE